MEAKAYVLEVLIVVDKRSVSLIFNSLCYL
jgi:hypothetical protein